MYHIRVGAVLGHAGPWAVLSAGPPFLGQQIPMTTPPLLLPLKFPGGRQGGFAEHLFRLTDID